MSERKAHSGPAAASKVLRNRKDWEEPSLAHLLLCPSGGPRHGELYHEATCGLEQVQITSYDDQNLYNFSFGFIKIYLVGKSLLSYLGGLNMYCN